MMNRFRISGIPKPLTAHRGRFSRNGSYLRIALVASLALLLACSHTACLVCDHRAERASAIQEFREFFKDSMPSNPESEAQWDRLARKLASMGPEVALGLVQLAREVATGDELAHVSRTYFFEPIWLLPKEQLREAGLLLVKMPEDHLPDQYTHINGLRALALVHDRRDIGIVLNSLESKHREVRAFATYCLGFWPDELVHDQVTKAMQSRDDDIQFEACTAAFNIGAESFAPEFQNLAAVGTPFDLRCLALEALANLGDEEAQQALLKMATDVEDTIPQAWAVRCLTRLEAYDDWQEVAALLQDSEYPLQMAVLNYLLQCPDAEAKAIVQDRISGDEALRIQIDDYRKWSLQKIDREDGKGYLLYAPPR